MKFDLQLRRWYTNQIKELKIWVVFQYREVLPRSHRVVEGAGNDFLLLGFIQPDEVYGIA